MVVVILGRTADRGIGIAAPRPRIAQPTREDHRLGLRHLVVAKHAAQRGECRFLHLLVAQLAVVSHRRVAVGEAQQDRPAGFLGVGDERVERAAPVGRLGQTAEPLRVLRPEDMREAEIDLGQDAGAVAQTADGLLLRHWRRRIDPEAAVAQQPDRQRDDGALGIDSLAALQGYAHTLVVPGERRRGRVEANIEPACRVVDQPVKATLGLGVAVEPFSREPFLGRELVPDGTVHALAHLDIGRDHQPVDFRQPPGAQQRFDGILDRDRARPAHVRQELALPARKGDRGVEGGRAHEGLAPLGRARRRRGALVDQEPVGLRADQLDAELAAP